MGAKSNIIDSKKNNALHYLTLVMGSWKKDIPENQRNVIIANALNHCSYKDHLKVVGYLITNRRVFLILKDRKESIDEILFILYEQVLLGIYEYEKVVKKYSSRELPTPKGHDHLFEIYPFYNYYIRRLITGGKIRLPYYDPHLARLEAQIHNYDFCSAIDYSGAKGPVVVHL